MRRGFLYRVTLIVAFLVLVLAVATGVWRYGYGQGLDQLAQRGQADLALASEQ